MTVVTEMHFEHATNKWDYCLEFVRNASIADEF